MIRTHLAIFLAASLLVGCGSTELTRRYKVAEWTERGAKQKPLVRVGSFSLSPTDEKAKSLLLQLSERGQAALINELGKKAKNVAELVKSLSVASKKPTPRSVDKNACSTTASIFS